VEEAAPVLGGGIDTLVVEVEETGTEEVIEAAEGETIDTMLIRLKRIYNF
jgi:hypothetical protein